MAHLRIEYHPSPMCYPDVKLRRPLPPILLVGTSYVNIGFFRMIIIGSIILAVLAVIAGRYLFSLPLLLVILHLFFV